MHTYMISIETFEKVNYCRILFCMYFRYFNAIRIIDVIFKYYILSC